MIHGTFMILAAQISIIIRVVSLVILIGTIIPLQVREAQVKNGLRILRYQFLIAGIIVFIINTTSLFFIFDILAHHLPQTIFNSMLQLINAIAFLVMAVMGYQMYHTQYSDESKERHKRLDKMEKQEELDKKNVVV